MQGFGEFGGLAERLEQRERGVRFSLGGSLVAELELDQDHQRVRGACATIVADLGRQGDRASPGYRRPLVRDGPPTASSTARATAARSAAVASVRSLRRSASRTSRALGA